MSKETFSMEDVPAEVGWVWAIQMSGQPVGLGTYDKIQVIIDNNPKWFPWEHKYKAIPQEVHDTYLKERYPGFGEPWTPSDKEWPGLIPHIASLFHTEPEVKEPIAQFSIAEFLENLDKQRDERLKREAEEEAKNKALWDKHYSKYKLEYRP